MKNFIQPGHTITLTAPTGGVTSGTPIKIGQILVVPATTVAEGLPFEGHVTGVFDLPKVGSQAWVEGALIYFDNGADKKHCTTTASGNLLIGVAVAVVGSGAGETTGRVRLNGSGRADEAVGGG